MLYKIVSILFFCMIKLQSLQSDKVHHLNAFLLAICAQLIGSCIQRVEEFIQQHEGQNTLFREAYLQQYEAYDRNVREARRERQKKMTDVTKKAPSMSSYSDRNSLSVGGSSQIEKGNQQQPPKEARKVKSTKLRRRRKRGQSTSSSESDLTSNFDSDSELSDVSSALSDTEDEEEDEENAPGDFPTDKATFNDFSMINLNGLTFNEVQQHAEDDDDVVVEEETIIFPTGDNPPELTVEVAKEEEEAAQLDVPKKMKFKQKFHKVDPNIIVEFAQTEITLKAIKVLFDWLRNNREIVISCHQTNPEFIHQTMTLLNHFNIDIFTSKVFFERQMLNVGGIRENLRELFDERLHIPIHEDMALKQLPLFVANQEQLDWEISSKMDVSACEENLLRLFKMLDFGFYICKTFKFNYVFCTKGRIFVENFLAKKKRRTKRAKVKQVDTAKRRQARVRPQSGPPKVASDASEDDGESSSGRKNATKRGYLRSRNAGNVTENEERDRKIEDGDKSEKYALMGKLWLRSEVKSLESKVKKPNGLHLTPYLMMDSKSLTEYQTTVRNLVKARKFVVLIPNAVLSELDELKKHSDRARNVIRWLEQEFKKGNRFLRSQRDHETLPLPLIKTPKKIDREASVFLQIAQFCNYIVTNQMNPDGSTDAVTLLTGENLVEKKCPHFSYYGILNSIPVKFDQIQGFYAKYRKK
uniref:Putative nonsense-mediated mrna decay protein n=1 Tax=Lutzomyia longipalpis TaxID=7200 RepID=A0A7G3ATP9_LUTLO